MDPSSSEDDLFFDALDAFPDDHDDDLTSPSSFYAAGVDSLRRRRPKPPDQSSVKPDSSISNLTSDLPTGDEIPSDAESHGLLTSIAGFVVRAVLFQFRLLFMTLKIPIWVIYSSFLIVTDPFGTLKLTIYGIKARFLEVLRFFIEKIRPGVGDVLGGQQGFGKLAVRLACGCFWAFYTGFVLLGLLATSFLGGRLVVGKVVKEPVRISEELNFDYTKTNPDAFVPLVPSGCASCGFESVGRVGSNSRARDLRPLPPNHKLQLMILLTLPESVYNRNLGVFQVRAELLSANGNVTSSASQPCMLRFKSPHIRFVETFLKSGTLLAGYSTESQILSLKMKGLTEGTEPSACVRVILEQRAEYRPGAGIPEIYAASLKLESELPLFKRMIWNWKITVFVWISTGLFIFQLMVSLVCCQPLIMPRRFSVGPSNRG